MIRGATAADRDGIAALHLASWRANYGAELDPRYLRDVLPGALRAKWAARTFAWPELGLVAEGDGLEGFAFVVADRPVPLIDNLHVRPGLQSRGTGGRLLRAGLEALAARGIARATLTVLESNPRGLAFYLREGGEDEGPVDDVLIDRPVRARRIGFATGA